MLLVWCCLDNKTFETSLPPHCPLKQNNNLFKQLRPLKNPSGSFIHCTISNPCRRRVNMFERETQKHTSWLPTPPLSWNEPRCNLHGQQEAAQTDAFQRVPHKKPEGSHTFKRCRFCNKTWTNLYPYNLHHWYNFTARIAKCDEIWRWPPKTPLYLLPLVPKTLFFASDRGELGLKLKLQVQESDTIS